MSMTRRQFLVKNAALVSLASLAPPLVLRRASAAAARADHRGRTLVVVELNGGNDGLNTVIPFEDPAYHRARPELRIREDVHRLDDRFALHPQMEHMKDFFAEGKLAIVHGVGYPKPNRSHFRSMDIWHTAQPESPQAGTGWLGRYLDVSSKKDLDGPPAVAFGERLPRSLLGRRVSVPTVQRLAEYGLFVEGTEDAELKKRLIQELPALESEKGSAVLDFLRRQARDTYRTARTLREAAGKFQPKSDYVGPLGEQLRMAAQVIAADLEARIIHVSLGGFDTHANQTAAHAELLGMLSKNLDSFFEDLGRTTRKKDVLVMTFSEFGRRVRENGSRGTDHGAAAPMFLLGDSVNGGLHGTHPSLSDLDDGDLKFTTDFRSIYATVLEEWLGTSSRQVLEGEFPTLGLIQAKTGEKKREKKREV